MSLSENEVRRPRAFSEVLEAVGQSTKPRLSIDEIADAFGERGIAAMILVLAVISLLPWPPGSKAIFSLPLILLSSELALQREEVWLPRWLLNRSVGREHWRNGVKRVLKPVRFVENLTRPRLAFLTGPVSKMAIGLTIVFLAIMMALPVPFGDMLPGATIAFYALGVMQRDGVAAIIGWFGTLLCAGYLTVVWRTVVAVGQHAVEWVQTLIG